MIKLLKGFSLFILLTILLLIILFAIIKSSSDISSVIALVGVLTALVSVVWTQYNKSIEETNKFKQFQIEKQHQITKEVYQNLFTEQVEVYKKLHNKLLQYKNSLMKIGTEQVVDEDEEGNPIYIKVTIEKVTLDTLKGILLIIKENIFLISDDIEVIFSELSTSYQKKENMLQLKLENDGLSEADANNEVDKSNRDYFIESKELIDKLFSQIKLEIKKIKPMTELHD